MVALAVTEAAEEVQGAALVVAAVVEEVSSFLAYCAFCSSMRRCIACFLHYMSQRERSQRCTVSS